MKQYVIKTQDLIENISKIKEKAGSSRVIAVLKGNGYGIGLIEFATVLRDNGIDFFAVSELEEAEELREAGFENDILLLTASAVEDDIQRAIDLNVILAIGSEIAFERVADIAKNTERTVRAHLKIDTGFGRFGFTCDKADRAVECIKKYPNIAVEGVFSHFSFSFSDSRKDVEEQYLKFLSFTDVLEKNDIFLMKHICNSCAFMQYKDMHLDGVRVGSAFLGRLPLTSNFGLKKIGTMRSNVIEIKNIPAGTHVGYANTYTAKKEMKIAVIPIGYKDGFGVEKSNDTFRFIDILRYMYHNFRSLGKKITVRIGNREYPLIGRVSMCNIIIDITGADVKIGDIAEVNANPILVDRSVERVYE